MSPIRTLGRGIRRLWDLLPHLHTLWSLLQAIGVLSLAIGVIGATGGVTISVWRSYGPMIGFFMGATGLLVGIWSVNGIVWMRHMRRTVTVSAQDPVVKLARRNRAERETIRKVFDDLIGTGEMFGSLLKSHDRGVESDPIISIAQDWLDDVRHSIWEFAPECANYILGDDGMSIEDAKLRYAGWDANIAALRLVIDRRVSRLWEMRSQLS